MTNRHEAGAGPPALEYRMILFRCRTDLLRDVDALAHRQDKSRAEVIRDSLLHHVGRVRDREHLSEILKGGA